MRLTQNPEFDSHSLLKEFHRAPALTLWFNTSTADLRAHSVSSTKKEQILKLSTNLCSEGTRPTSDPCIYKTLWTTEQGIVCKERRENQNAQILIYDIKKSCNLILCSIYTLFLFVCLSLQSKEKFSKFYTPMRGSSSYLSILSFTMRAPF